MLCVAHLKGVIHARSMVSFGRPECTITLEIDDLLCHHLRAPTGVQDAQKGTQLCSRSGAHIPFLGAKSEARK